ncbi:MAG: 30S ribosomal protein S2 [Candidatus Caldarchaeum sp.]
MTLSAEQEAAILEQLVKYNVHIGSRIKVRHMEQYIFKMRYDGVYLFDIKKILERLNLAARMISYYPLDKVVAVSTHVFGMKAVQKYAELTGGVAIAGKMPAGMLTNRTLKNYLEPALVIISDPRYDVQALEEARIARVPVIAMCSTDNTCSNVDLVIPMNNRSRTSLPYAFWYLTRKVLEETRQLSPDFDALVKPEDFMALAASTEIE